MNIGLTPVGGIIKDMERIDKASYNLIAKWRENPLRFVEEAILEPYNKAEGTDYKVTKQQEEGIRAVGELVSAKVKKSIGEASPEEEELAKKIGVSIMSGRGTGKDAWAVWMILWFLSCFPYPKVPCTSVSADQLNKVLWSEIDKWLRHSLVKDWFTLQSDKLYHKDAGGQRWFAFPKTANPKSSIEEQVETLAGVHEDYVCVVVDEGSGIPDAVFAPLEGTLTRTCNFMIMIFNPTRSKGYAIDTQYKHKDYWIALRWNAEESELVSKETIERVAQKYGKDSNPYRIRVLGLPPRVDEETLIPWDWIEDAVLRENEPIEGEPIIKGLDCGGGGDRSIIATRKGYKVFPMKYNNSPDPVVLANWAGNDIDAEQPDVFRVDTVGLGWAVEGMLREKKGAIIEAADSRRTADNPDKFHNKRAEMYWNLRDAFQRGLIDIPDDQDLKDELGAIKHEIDDKGRIKIIEKKKIKQTLGHSPDIADALALTFYHSDELVSLKIPSEFDTIFPKENYPFDWMGA